MIFLHNDKLYVQLDQFDSCFALQEITNIQKALLEALRLFCIDENSITGPGIVTVALTGLLRDFTINQEQVEETDRRNRNVIANLLAHPEADTLFLNPSPNE